MREFRPILTHPEIKKPEGFMEKAAKLTSTLIDKFNAWEQTQTISIASIRMLSAGCAITGCWFFEALDKHDLFQSVVFGSTSLISGFQLYYDLATLAGQNKQNLRN